ncbi:FIG000605: protein co-occurring with transport systems (COG1739) [Amycolatopsis camponoti]|uniref:FIG000605: protein co-occurring with transport systems (COG1739) n=1 Tax=Amycolatopsis camponoti TaxID=2606593 RepID=A0A6I8LH14_9PSEU|nr:YigZ family protein [Amycolatopsis camponoti]VVJ16403.1 FIG000605: protein co-occurring with transport systems (COG1739) [Amycolatopsis camponoti]
MTDRYLSVARSGVHEIEIKRSRFLCALAPVTSEEAAREFIAARRRAEPGARHHCHAFVLGPDGRTRRSSDDGEPAGTAGTPMLEVLRRRSITDTVAVVTRYFGGVLLGAGGLIRAYGQSVSDALEVVGVLEHRRLRLVEVAVSYDRAGRLENDLRASSYLVHATHFDASARFEIGLAPDEVPAFEGWLANLTNGEATATELGDHWVVHRR